MRILLVYTNRYEMLRPAPIGIAYLCRALLEANHEVEVQDMLFAKDPARLLDEAITRFKPEIVGFSIRNLDNQDMDKLITPLPEIKEYVQSAKRRDVLTVLGGSAFTTLPGEMFEFMDADYGIAGQGERALPMLLEAITSQTDMSLIPGLVRRLDGKVHLNTPDMSGYNHIQPDWSRISLSSYKKGLFFLNTIVKCGCSFECTYCNVSCTVGSKPILKDIGMVVDDMKNAVKTLGIRTFFLTDPSFSFPIDYTKDLLRAVAAASIRAQLIASVVPVPGCYDEEFFTLFMKAGGRFSVLGSESLSSSMLKSYRKPFAVDDIIQWSTLAHKAGLKFAVDLMIGGPGETKETVMESASTLQKLHFTMVMYGIGIRILPNTALRDVAVEEGIIEASDNLLVPKFYVSPTLDVPWARGFLNAETKKYSSRMIGMAPIGIMNFIKRHGIF
jgi:radical SAM superfamily enzyme YgiQ (UPF0313 family)